jgi:hypothetical protein
MNTHHHKNLKSHMPGISKGFVNVQITKNIENRLLDWTRQKYHLSEDYCICDCVAKIPVFSVMANVLANLNANFCTFS